ncbi:MAG: carbohydrate kinase family protein [Bacillota bacterium]|nr:carbohydrate kinase family protein [Bacillota bacterium]
MKKVLVLGGVSYDEIIRLDRLPDGSSRTVFGTGWRAVGSTGAGKSLNLTKLGVANTLHATIGDDPDGRAIRAFLASRGVDAIYDDVPVTDHHVNLMDGEGNRLSIFTVPERKIPAVDVARLEQLIASHDVIVLNIIPYTKQLIPLIKKQKKEIWTDLHDYVPGNPYYDDFIAASEVIFLSSDQTPGHLRLIDEWIAAGKRLVVVTHGKNGAAAKTADGPMLYEPIINTYQLVDANGAGDAFFAGFLYGYLLGEPISKCLCYGTIAGGVTVSSRELVAEELSPEYIETMYRLNY